MNVANPTITADPRGTPLVELRDISISFGGIKAVDHVSVDLYPGEVVGLLGHNGAGKSTLIKCLSGAYQADAKEGCWIQTVPGKGFFVILRLYNPLSSFFDKTWRPSEIEPHDT